MATTYSANEEKKSSNLFLTLVRFRELSIIIIIILLMILVSIRTPAFLTIENFRDILLNISILVIVALGQTMVIITRGIDLSVGSMIGLVAMMVSFVVVSFPEMSPILALVLGIGLGASLGAFNGFLKDRPCHLPALTLPKQIILNQLMLTFFQHYLHI